VTVDAAGIARAQALLVAHRPEEALRELAALPAGAATSPMAYQLRATALNRLERSAEAADAARAGLAAGGPDPDLLGELGHALREQGDLPAAERALLDGLALAPADVDLLCAYSRLCMDAGQLEKAAMLVERAVAGAPEAQIVYATRIRLAYAQGKDAEAQRISRDFVAAYPESPAAHAALGGTSAVRGQIRPAYAGLRQAAAGAPTDADFAAAAMQARVASHPLLWPLRPIERFGAIKTWLVAVAVIFGLRAAGLAPLAVLAALLWFAICVYSWVVPPLMRRWMLRRWR
jgi:tetratricopeptide (TPR) repeat protein